MSIKKNKAMEKKLGQEPAFPLSDIGLGILSQGKKTDGLGMSKRFYAACAAMQGLLHNYYAADPIIAVRLAYKFADELLNQERE